MRIDPTLRALADPTRLRIMRLLAHMELAVGELAQVLGQSQPRVSRHVRILCDAGLAERRKEGAWVFLRCAIGPGRAPPLGAAAAQLLDLAERDDAGFAARVLEDRRHLAAIRAARETSAEAYFARYAAEWDTLRSLHAHARLGFTDEQMLSLLSEAGFAAEPPLALPGQPLTVKIWTARRGSTPVTAPRGKAATR
jgi:ArsR family transcriptional regulator